MGYFIMYMNRGAELKLHRLLLTSQCLGCSCSIFFLYFDCFLCRLIYFHISGPKRNMLYTSKQRVFWPSRGDMFIYSAFSLCFVFSSCLQSSVTQLCSVSFTAGQQPQQEILLCEMFKTVNVFLLSRACSSWLSALDSFCPSTHSFGFLNFI